MSAYDADNFYVVAREAGAENPSLPTWANRIENPAKLDLEYSVQVERREIAAVPGAFQLLNVLSAEECQRLIELTESLDYLPDAAVSLPREVRHNDSLTWVVDPATDQIIWDRCRHVMKDTQNLYGGRSAEGINARFRFYRYGQGDYFKFHRDGAWPGSRVIDNELVASAYPELFSEMTFLLLLSEDFEGGATRFMVNGDDPKQPLGAGSARANVDIRTPAGSVLCFPHGTHPMHRIHSSTPIERGRKYILRTDVLFRQ